MKGVHPMETLRFSNFLDPYIQTMPDSMQDGMLYRLTYAENLTRLTFYVTFPQLVPATDFFSLEKTLQQALEIETVRIAPNYAATLCQTAYFPELLQLLKREQPVVNGFFDHAQIQQDGQCWTITLKNGGYEIVQRYHVAEQLQNLLQRLFSVSIKVEILGEAAVSTESYQQMQETAEKTVSTTDPDCGMFVKGEHERQFAYEAHTACDKHGFVLGVEVTSGNVSDSVAWDAVYDKVTDRFPEVKFVTMDAGYKTPWIAKKVIEDSRIPILPYTRYKGKKDTFKPWDFTYNVVNDSFVCPGGHELRHTTTSKDGKRTYRSATQVCKDCPCRSVCGANENGQRMLTTHIWQEFLDLVEQLRKTERGKEIYAMRKQTIERVFADAKEKHAMRYTHHRGLARVSAWVRLKYAAMNLKKLALWKWSRSDFFVFLPYFFFDTTKTPALA